MCIKITMKNIEIHTTVISYFNIVIFETFDLISYLRFRYCSCKNLIEKLNQIIIRKALKNVELIAAWDESSNSPAW